MGHAGHRATDTSRREMSSFDAPFRLGFARQGSLSQAKHQRQSGVWTAHKVQSPKAAAYSRRASASWHAGEVSCHSKPDKRLVRKTVLLSKAGRVSGNQH